MAKTYLDKAYDGGTGDSRALYAQWSDTYDQEVSQNGYATPGRAAKTLAQYVTDLNQPILDYGCGTGLSGLALKLEGFSHIDGLDVSSEMLEIAKKKNIYRDLLIFNPDHAPPVIKGQYHIIAAIGVIGVGAAPLPVFDTVMNLLETGGLFVFSFNDHALADPSFPAKVDHYTANGLARLLACNYGDHLPGANLKSNVYVLEKL
ncbi:MAG: methyltransferase domain-containing protein [Marinovum sp.]|jgi:predicted TPR repeat methyltransferase|nr:methyltransferase domain-containing protein [Marinovum sp.]